MIPINVVPIGYNSNISLANNHSNSLNYMSNGQPQNMFLINNHHTDQFNSNMSSQIRPSEIINNNHSMNRN
jgi:hypothetical protein